MRAAGGIDVQHGTELGGERHKCMRGVQWLVARGRSPSACVIENVHWVTCLIHYYPYDSDT